MKLISLLACLLVLSACSEKTKEETIPEKKSCKYFSQHSRKLPIVNSAIEIFEGQQFDAVLELKDDSVSFITSVDTSITEPIKILTFIDKEETAPYREIISQSLLSEGYWIYYACYDTLGRECFLPEFYDIDHFRKSETFEINKSSEKIRIIQNNFGGIMFASNYFSSHSDSAMNILTQFISSKNESEDNLETWENQDQLPYRWINRSLLNKLKKLNFNIEINKLTINQAIYILNNHINSYDDLQPFSKLKYATNFQSNLNTGSLICQSWSALFKQFKIKYKITEKELRLFTKEELQILPFEISSPLLFFYWTNSMWQIVPSPPPTIKKAATPPPPAKERQGGTIGTKKIEKAKVVWPDEIEIIEEDQIEIDL